MMIAKTDEGTARAYRRQECGSLEVIELPIVDGQVTDSMGLPYDTEAGEIVDLAGWPDSKAVEVAPGLLVGIRQ
jgi:hypothetical protein